MKQTPKHDRPDRKRARWGISGLFLFGLLLVITACNMPTKTNSSLDSTKAVLDVQSTVNAQQASQNAQATVRAGEATRIAQDVLATSLAGQATQLAQQATQQAQQAAQLSQATPTSPPATIAPPPTNPPSEVPPTSPPPPTEIPPSPTPDFEAMMKSAKILLFEDMAGLYEPRYIRSALDMMGLPYVDVGDASGNFKNQLLSGTDWDLIIVGAESRVKIQGEFFVYINDALKNGSSVIIEIWALDEIASGKINTITTQCGIKFQKDWWEPESPSLWPLAPEHPVFHEPNEGMSLVHFVPYWSGDAGDLIEMMPGGKATLLVGNIATEKYRYGTVASCLDGRLIIQTFSSHNYRQEDVTRLWQNYIYNTLRSRFLTRE